MCRGFHQSNPLNSPGNHIDHSWRSMKRSSAGLPQSFGSASVHSAFLYGLLYSAVCMEMHPCIRLWLTRNLLFMWSQLHRTHHLYWTKSNRAKKCEMLYLVFTSCRLPIMFHYSWMMWDARNRMIALSTVPAVESTLLVRLCNTMYIRNFIFQCSGISCLIHALLGDVYVTTWLAGGFSVV